MKKRIYIAGKISGLPEDIVKQKFQKSESIINNLGHIPVNPLKIVPNRNDETPDEYWQKAMSICIPELMKCDVVMLQDDWLLSKGAKIEYYLAQEMGKQIVSQSEYERN